MLSVMARVEENIWHEKNWHLFYFFFSRKNEIPQEVCDNPVVKQQVPLTKTKPKTLLDMFKVLKNGNTS